MDWTQKELEELYQKVNQRAATDADFRKDLLEDAHAAIEKVAGRALPEGFRLETIEADLAYSKTFLAPDFAPGELDLRTLKTVAGGQGEDQSGSDSSSGDAPPPDSNIAFALIINACAAAVEIGPGAGDTCGAAGCTGDACAGNACGAAGCIGAICAGDASGIGGCTADGCSVAACGAEGCAVAGCAGDTCIADGCGGAGCLGAACAAESCIGYGGYGTIDGE